MIVYDRETEKDLATAKITFEIKVNERSVRFNVAAGKIMGLISDGFVVFINIGHEWFACKSRTAKGYILKSSNPYGNSFHASASIFIKQFSATLRHRRTTFSYRLRATAHEHEGEKLFLIDSRNIL